MSYRVAPIVLIRLAGAPFEILEQLATPQTSEAARAQKEIVTVLERELEAARKFLYESARKILPDYLIFSAEGMRERMASLSEAKTIPPSARNSRMRERERHLLLYLQRLAAKNDTFGAFGPSSWGEIVKGAGVSFAPEQRISTREVFLERWVAHALAAAINADPENTNPKLSVPALEPHAVEVLRADVEEWLPSAARDKWLSILQS
ncbi:MAG: hypothetical protein DME57_02200 [Verrucomicrobia bacterium]|nr:MAG: hypothetical protein DME57_02200 [Verrucomicrobiota bacterium]